LIFYILKIRCFYTKMQKSVLTSFTIIGIIAFSCCLQQEEIHSKEYWDELGYNLSHTGKYKEAIEAYDKVLEVDPNNAKEWYNKGYCLSKLGRYDEALKAYDKALELDPTNIKAWYNKGVTLLEIGKCEEAIEISDKLEETYSVGSELWNDIGACFGEQNKDEEALKAFNRALELNPENFKALRSKALSLQKLGRYEEALRAYEIFLEENPRDFVAWNNKCPILLMLGENEEALNACNKALEINSSNPDAWNNKGLVLFALGRYDEALEAYNKALEINPAHEDAWNNRNYILELNSSIKWILYNNSKYSFSAEIPRGWKMTAPKLEEIETVIKPNFVITFTRELNETIEAMITIGKTRSDIDFDEFVGYMDSDKSRIDNLMIIGRDKVEINGDNVWLIKMKISEKEGLRLIEAIFECKNKDVLTVTVGSLSSKYSRYNETFYHIIRSVRC